MQQRYPMYFRKTQADPWEQFGACYAESTARIMVAEYMLFTQQSGQMEFAGYVCWNEKTPAPDNTLPFDSPLVKTLTVEEANLVL